ncbi:hypothetical protein NG697_12515 [Pseudarthrobacter sp. MDT3-26]|uniref:hypothetical protein n=1 Tax=Pseudarthrobacter raffinosi TaxID=2953651 RepID=UPI00208E7E1B|nr:hypothetical protein [Pseudarthrobacter sp. MDT3-26]MCO4263735.1 hypothetical protein [Pseudarthrobacter sp. MDT3-26]
MTGIGIGLTLDDMGIDCGPVARRAAAFTDDREQYDFTLHRLALGSWRRVRDCFRDEGRARSNGDLPLWFLLHWGEVELEDEASIKERLSALRYPWRYRNLFDEFLCSLDDEEHAEPDPDRTEKTRWWGAERQPVAEVGAPISTEAFEALLGRFPDHEHEAICIRLLGNPYLDARFVSVTAQLLAKQSPWSLAFVIDRSELPADVIELILGMDETSAHGAQERLIELEHLDPQTLTALIGKCDRKAILTHQDCTQAVRVEIDQLGDSDGVLSHKERREAAAALDWARRDLASGAFTKTGRYFSIRDRRIADAVQANAEIGLYEINELLNTNIDEDEDF